MAEKEIRYPKRFYRSAKDNKRELKYPKNQIKQCSWCGTFFLIENGVGKFCSKRCKHLADAIYL